jgi:hypothetical protein
MVVPPGNHPAVPRDSDLRRTCSVRRKVSLSCLSRACRGESVEGRPEDARKDGHIRGRSRWFVHNAGWGNKLCYSKGMERYKVTLYSIGHGTRTAAAFVSLLCSFNIQHLADIRSYPGSRRNPQFRLEPLRESLEQAGISYTWLPDLGGLRRMGLGAQSPHQALTSAALRNYADHTDSPEFASAVKQLLRLATPRRDRTCFMCAETAPQRCHRLLLADYLFGQGVQVIHILDRHRSFPHDLSPHATIRQGRIIYAGPDHGGHIALRLP